MKSLLPLTLCLLVSFAISEAQAVIYEFTEGNKIELMKDPEISVDDKIKLIENAKHHVHIATYFWDDSGVPSKLSKALIAANERGVEVRILSSYIPSVSTDIFGKGRKALRQPEGKAPFIFLTLRPAMGFTMYHNIHEKIFLVDGEVAVIGGRNVSDSSLSGKDLEVSVKGPMVHQLQLHFQNLFNFVTDLQIESTCKSKNKDKCTTRIKSLQFDQSQPVYYPEAVVYEDGVRARLLSHDALINYKKHNYSKEQRLSQEDDILDVVINVKFEKVIGYAYFMTLSQRFYNFIKNNLDDNKSIQLMTNSIESAKFSSNKGYIYSLPISRDLVKAGLDLYQWNRDQKLNYVHEKLLIFDDERIFIGSHNFGTGSTTVSNEIMIEFYSKEIAKDLTDEFNLEIGDTKMSSKATLEQLQLEINENKKMLNFLMKESVSKVINEIY